MNLVDEKGKEIPLLVVDVDVIEQVSPDRETLSVRDKPDTLLSAEDRLLIVGWKINNVQQSGLHRQGRENSSPEQGRPAWSSSRKAKKWTCVQRLETGVVGKDTGLKVMFDCGRPDSLILHKTAEKAGLRACGEMKWLLSAASTLYRRAGHKQLIKARGVNYTVYSEARRVPAEAGALFPEMTKKALTAHQTEGLVDM
jgi:hypothetical protein